MLRQIVFHVKSENRINQQQVIVANKIIQAGLACPKCGKGIILKGNSAYGCSRWKEGCEFRMPFGN
jgi:DNA topoisomerase-3